MSSRGGAVDRGTFRCTLQVRWADFDQYGHVNNVKYIEYAQEARILFIRSRFGPFGLGNLPQVVRRVEIGRASCRERVSFLV